MTKVVNKATFITLVDIETKMNVHIESCNREGWELFNIAQQTVGIQEFLILLWRKTVEVKVDTN